MGIIIRQSVKSAIWSYLGIMIGYINVGIIMPQFFDTAEVGLVQLFASVSLIFAQFGTLGFTSVINRLFPRFRDPAKAHNGFLFLALTTGLIGFVLSTSVFIIFQPWVVETNLDKSPLLVDYLWWMIPLVFMRILFLLLDNYNKMLYDAVTGTFWMEFMHKVINLGLIVLFAFGWIGFRLFFAGYLLSMSLPVLPVVYVLLKRGNFKLHPYPGIIPAQLRKETLETTLFGFVNGLGGVVLLNVDKVFVNQYLSLDEVGIFGVCSLFSLLIRVPYNSISKIAVGVIAEAWKRNDREQIKEIYRKSAVNQGIVGTLIYVGILVNLHNIFEILPPVYESGKWVMVIYSAGMLVNTVLGLAGNITEISRHFRYSTLFLFISIVLQFGLSFLLIPRMGITGAAISTMVTLVISVLLQVSLQWFAYGIYGVNIKLLTILGIGSVSYLAGYLIPRLPLIPDILGRSAVVTLIFGGLVLILRVSPELNLLVSGLLKKLLRDK